MNNHKYERKNLDYFNIKFYLISPSGVSQKIITRKATQVDVDNIFGTWDRDPDGSHLIVKFTHPESLPICIRLDILDTIDCEKAYEYIEVEPDYLTEQD